MEYDGLIGLVSITNETISRKHYLARTVEDDVVHPKIYLVQESSVEEVTELWLLVQKSALRKEALECGPRKRRIRDRSRVMGVEVACILGKPADCAPVSPP